MSPLQRFYRAVGAAAVCVLAVSAVCGAAPAPWTYQIELLPGQPVYNYAPQVNSSGMVTWYGFDGSDQTTQEIYLYDGSATTQLTNNSYWDRVPEINAHGHVVWYGGDGNDNEVYYYDGATTTPLTCNTGHEWGPQLNDYGQAAWYGQYGAGKQAYCYDGAASTRLSTSAVDITSVRINNQGHVVWCDTLGADQQVYYYNGSTVSGVSPSGTPVGDVAINDSNQLAWRQYDGTNWEAWFRDGGTAQAITQGTKDVRNLRLNESGQMAWYTLNGSIWLGGATEAVVQFWDGTTVTDVCSFAWPYIDFPLDPWAYGDISISDTGAVAWTAWDGHDWEVFYWDQTAVYQVTDTPYSEDGIDLSGNWLSWRGDFQVFRSQYVPEPSIMVLLGVGALGLARRKRA